MENERLRQNNSPSWGKHNPYGITPKHDDPDFYSNESYIINQDTTVDSPNEAPISRNPKTTKNSTNPRAISNVKTWP